ncbi:putative spermidine/putrescine transport system permease protein [Paraburkholderia atlantica]|uniref:ABC-type spermidine/putrescine transport system permease subunit I n=1 Tax=Paraburkholderia atlantica TaxID=2654982 RepID=A0A7W8VAL6_PARAM|nr:ABC transporter permease subunit [Paraburkholderia atlantica]MBB5429147.1 ABC-type spermidine/putrescine transport system permease subunit I [Paraburkholderia atlantica]
MSTLATLPHASHRTRRWMSPYAMLCAPALLVLATFFGMPLYENAMRSVGISAIQGTHSAFMFAYYHKLFTDPYYVGIMIETLRVSVLTTLWCLVIGYPVAWFMVRRAGRFASPLMFVLIMPLLTSHHAHVRLERAARAPRSHQRHAARAGDHRAAAAHDAKPRDRLCRQRARDGVVHGAVDHPVLRSVDQRLEESARVLGAGALRAFVVVTLPLSVEGIITGCLIVFMIVNGSFICALLLGGGSIVTLPLLIFQQFSQSQDMGLASATGNLLLIIVLICLYAQGRLIGRGKAAGR